VIDDYHRNACMTTIASTPNADQRFHFDALGYLHLRGALSAQEVAECLQRIDALAGSDTVSFNADRPEAMKQQLNRPFSRIIDLDPWFLRWLEHPASAPFLRDFLGEDYRHIDNDVLFTHPQYAGGTWHRGVRADPAGDVRNSVFHCPMVKVFHCLTDLAPDQGAFVIVPGSHKANLEVALDRVDLPGQRIFDDVRAGDLIIFNEGLLHNGRPNPSPSTRKTLIFNFGRSDAGVWAGYAPAPATLAAATARQREIIGNGERVWRAPE
jgi:hypothetical protein